MKIKYQNNEEIEIGTIKKNWHNRIPVALVYPNEYRVGMSNLGFQTVYKLFNDIDNIVCERVFFEDNNDFTFKSLESKRPLCDFDIIAFSISFENDYPNILKILDNSKIPLLSSERYSKHPLIMAGGIACFLNPEPISLFIDIFLLGEAEVFLPEFFNFFEPLLDRKELLKSIAKNVAGAYVPSFYKARYNSEGILSSFSPLCDVPPKIKRVYIKEIFNTPTCSVIITKNTSFHDTFLIETGRGCPHGCRFCAAGYVYRPPRFRPMPLIEKSICKGLSFSKNIGLVGAAVSDLPDIEMLYDLCCQKEINISFSSLRADAFALNSGLIKILKQQNIKTVTIAPEAGSEKMLRVINKGITKEDILNAVEILVSNDILNIKLYFMVGLPTENDEDIDGIIELCQMIKKKFLITSRTKGRMGNITISINSFIPKPFTPFQWASMNLISELKTKIKKIKKHLNKIANIKIHADIPNWSYIYALLSRGDRNISEILLHNHKNKGNWTKTLKETSLNTDNYVIRERSLNELLPWDFIDHGIDKSFLINEWKRALAGKQSPPCPIIDSCSSCGVCRYNGTR